jgi:Tat protein translocase TatB subunit
MFDVGFSELVLLFVIGLLILGPERLPRVAAQLGRWMGKARRTAHQLRMQLEREMTMNDIMREQKKRQEHDDGATPGGSDAGQSDDSGDADEDSNDSGHADAADEISGNEGDSGATSDAAADTGSAKGDESKEKTVA